MGSAGKRNYSVVHLNYMIKLSATVFPFIQVSYSLLIAENSQIENSD